MAKSLESILGHVFLTGLVEQVKTGIPKVLPDAFWSTKKDVLGDAVQDVGEGRGQDLRR